MNKKNYHKLRLDLLYEAKVIMESKQKEYTNNNKDILYNFKTTAEMLKLKPIQVWAVFLHKHIQSIMTHTHNKKIDLSEPIEGRFADAINYLILGLAIIKDDE